MEGLLKISHEKMAKVSDYRTGTSEYSMSNVLMSGLAMLGLKYPSLLPFDKNKDKLRIKHTSEPCAECVAPRATIYGWRLFLNGAAASLPQTLPNCKYTQDILNLGDFSVYKHNSPSQHLVRVTRGFSVPAKNNGTKI
jgi:hypothetical protein